MVVTLTIGDTTFAMEQLWNDMRTTVYETMGIEQTAAPVNPEEDEADSMVQSLSQELDVDALNEDFKKFAGLDDMLSRAEYDTFIKTKKIPPAIAGVLWSLLDTDGSGEVSKDEFKSALLALQSSRSWSRYCPACEYRNDCAFCQECNSGCPRCSDVSFCASCWNDHPGRQLTMEEQALHPLRPLRPLRPLHPLHPLPSLRCPQIAMARHNARMYGVEHRILFVVGDALGLPVR